MAAAVRTGIGTVYDRVLETCHSILLRFKIVQTPEGLDEGGLGSSHSTE